MIYEINSKFDKMMTESTKEFQQIFCATMMNNTKERMKKSLLGVATKDEK